LEIKQEKTGDLTGKLTVVIAPDDYRDQVNTVLKDYAKKANIKGFRKGMVPTSIVRKMFGKGVIFEELNKIVGKALNDYVVEERLALVGEPLPTGNNIDLDAEKDQSYELNFEIGLSGDFKIDYQLAGSHPIYTIVADDALIDKEVEGMRTQYGEMSNPDESQAGDTLFGKLWEVDGSGNVVEGGLERMYALNPERVASEALKAEMGNAKKAEDRIALTMADITTSDAEIREIWEKNVSGEQVREVSDEELAEIKGKHFAFEVRKVNRVEKLDVDQALFDKVFGEGSVTSLADFRDRLAGDIEKHLNGQALKLYRSMTIRALVEGTDIQLPHDFMKRWLIATREQINEGNVESIFNTFLRSYKWKMIVEQMQAENEQVKVTQENIIDRARAMVKSQFGAMLGEGDDSRLESFVQYYLQDEKMMQRLFDDELEDRVFAHINSINAAVEEETTGSDFIDKLKKENEANR
jgi:trigger factor